MTRDTHYKPKWKRADVHERRLWATLGWLAVAGAVAALVVWEFLKAIVDRVQP